MGRLLSCLLLLLGHQQALAQDNDLSDKNVTFYTSYGYLGGDNWIAPLKLWVSTPPSKIRRLTARTARTIIQKRADYSELSEEQKKLFAHRTNDFIADSKSKQVVTIEFDLDPDGERLTLSNDEGNSRTDFNGLLQSTVTISKTRATQLLEAQNSENGWLRFQAVSGSHHGSGQIQLIPPSGTSIISDIDDTIKITEIPAGEKVVLRNTFFKPFEATPCMAEFYRTFAKDSAFHYVSGGPWQLYAPVSNFIFSHKAGFPLGSVHMKNVRTNLLESKTYEDFLKLTGIGGSATVAQKNEQIKRLLRHFPNRRFILIGDSGEHDPEIFSGIRQQHPGRIKSIYIRDVTNAAQTEPDRFRDISLIDPDDKC